MFISLLSQTLYEPSHKMRVLYQFYLQKNLLLFSSLKGFLNRKAKDYFENISNLEYAIVVGDRVTQFHFSNGNTKLIPLSLIKCVIESNGKLVKISGNIAIVPSECKYKKIKGYHYVFTSNNKFRISTYYFNALLKERFSK